MRSPRPLYRSGAPLLLLCALAASGAAVACSEAAGSGDPNLVIEVSQDQITVENLTGTPLMKGEVSVIPPGTVPRPYTMMLAHLSIGEKRAFVLTSFRNEDGARFMRGTAKGRVVRVVAKDVGGKTYEREVPFK